MARKGKVGIDYFSHDVDMLQDKKIKLLKAKHGLVGYAVFIRLLEELYREEGYYLKIDDDFNILFSDDNNLDYNVYILILNECIEKGLFNKTLYNKHKILTSVRIQNNYCSATERRKEVEFIKEYLLVDPSDNYNIDRVNVCINDLNVDINTQSKKKVKESIVKEIYRKVQHLELSLEEFEKLSEEHTKEEIDDILDQMENWAKLKSKKSAYLTAKNWLKKRKQENNRTGKVVTL